MDKFKVKKTKKGYTISYYRDDNTEDILVIKNYDDLAKLNLTSGVYTLKELGME